MLVPYQRRNPGRELVARNVRRAAAAVPALVGAANVIVRSERLVNGVKRLVRAGVSYADAINRVYGVVSRHEAASNDNMQIVHSSNPSRVEEIEDVDISQPAPSSTDPYPRIEEDKYEIDEMDLSGDLPSNGLLIDELTGHQPTRGSHFIKMRKYRGRRYKRKRGRRFKKRGKFVTKRGVKALISRNVRFSNQNVDYCLQNKFWCGGGWGKRAFQVVPFNFTQASWGDINDMSTNIVSKLELLQTVTPGAATAPQAYSGVYTRAGMVKFMFHSSLNEDVIVTFWVIQPRCPGTPDAADGTQEWWSSLSYPYSYSTGVYNFNKPNMGPLYRWYHEWTENKTVGSGALFEGDFTTYPTKYPQFNKEYKILKKYTVVFRPGETKTLRMKIPGIMFNSQTSELDLTNTGLGMDHYTRFLMCMIEGVPTHQNNAGTEDESVIGRTICRLEGTYHIVRRVGGFSTKPISWQYKDFNLDNVTAARSIVTASAAQIQTT